VSFIYFIYIYDIFVEEKTVKKPVESKFFFMNTYISLYNSVLAYLYF